MWNKKKKNQKTPFWLALKSSVFSKEFRTERIEEERIWQP